MANAVPATLTESILKAGTSVRSLTEWRERVARREARVGIIGLGYVGLPLTLLFSSEGFRVTGFDVDTTKIDTLNRGESYIWRIEPDHIAAAQSKGFTATTDFAQIADMDAVLICVPTPLTDHHAPDLSYVEATVHAIAPYVRAGQLIVLESTTYPGTTEEIVVRILMEAGAKRDVQVQIAPEETKEQIDGVLVAFSPEREDPGNMITPRREIPKVVGGMDVTATEAACALYGAIFHRTVPVSSPATAEMTKLLENIYRSVNIALVNEMKQLCMKMGVDIWEVIDAAATKPFGFQAFYPGPGIGGHCIPVDPFYLTWKAKEYGFTTRFIQLAGEVNEEMPIFVMRQVARALNEHGIAMKGAKVLVLGVAYKADVDDLRESPALVLIEQLQSMGCEVSYNDPFFPTVGHGRKYALNMESTPLERVPEFDCVVIATDHSSYEMERIVADAKLVVDSRNATRHIASPKIVRC
ncbi:nucleotide sugar dehydrogenase [Terriglobus roseus]|uniref:UDP-N-acetyl-D-glucosamine dehydrogenase n=1 Tax=Terriglobus roseus TaxID=392734 RepID=A0A1H4P496_9BACT|nr:nucleotide sugar dehydrogenase [Terriglobus roseus]SEC02174.1 UDP-N-acetyl-D-glucosamine dehydrogenase [Terriglobus roseus]